MTWKRSKKFSVISFLAYLDRILANIAMKDEVRQSFMEARDKVAKIEQSNIALVEQILSKNIYLFSFQSDLTLQDELMSFEAYGTC